MNLYLCTFCVDCTPYVGSTQCGEKDFRLVYADDEDAAQVKLERALGTDRTEPGSDIYWLRDFEAHLAIS